MTDAEADSEKLSALRLRYARAAHAMQSGVAFSKNVKDLEPKHLRCGINSAHVSDAAIARLLIAKGIFTEAEYIEAVTEEMEKEAASYSAKLSGQMGAPVILG